MAVLIKDSQRLLKTDKRRIRKITEDLLKSLRLQDKDLSILLVNNNKIRALNKHYFGKDRPTNVISFSYTNGLPAEVLGDIIVSLERAKEEAHSTGSPFYERIFALIIHGLLHIIGFDHEKGSPEARQMKRRERKLMRLVVSHELYNDLS